MRKAPASPVRPSTRESRTLNQKCRSLLNQFFSVQVDFLLGETSIPQALSLLSSHQEKQLDASYVIPQVDVLTLCQEH